MDYVLYLHRGLQATIHKTSQKVYTGVPGAGELKWTTRGANWL